MKLLLVDGMALLYRAYYALIRRPLRDSQGRNTSAIFGFAQVMLSLLERARPTHWAVAFDTPAPTFRRQRFPAYKAQRPPMPEDLVPQIGEVRRLLEGLRVPLLLRDGYEADDLMAALGCRAAHEGAEVLLYSSDKDLLQVVDERVHALVPRGSGEEAAEMGPDQVREAWGVGPEHIVDLLALMGDASDNVPGVRGVGEKTAVKLMRQFGSLDRLYANLDEVAPPSLREKLRAGRADAYLARELVTLDLGAPVAPAPEELAVAEFDVPRLVELCRAWDFRRLGQRFAAMAGTGPAGDRFGEPGPVSGDAAAPGAAAVAPVSVTADAPAVAGPSRAGAGGGPVRAERAAEAERAFREWLGVERAALELTGEGGGVLGVEPEWMVLAGGGRRAAVHWRRAAAGAGVRAAAAEFFARGPELVVADAQAAAHRLRRAGLPGPRVADDLRLAAYVLEMRGAEREELLAGAESGAPAPGENFSLGLGEEAAGAEPNLERLWGVLERRLAEAARLRGALESRGQLELYRLLELPLAPLLAEMEETGVRVDLELLGRLSVRYTGELRDLERDIHRLAGVEFNINSSRQLAEVLFEKHRLPAGRRTKTGLSTDSDVLEELAQTHELPLRVLQYRQLAKLLSTYVEALPAMVDPATGRIHARFHQTVVPTGRLSSSEPNLQNIPVRTAQGREIRRAFVAAPGGLLVSADYSQIELRMMAHFSGEPAFLEAFARGEDIHARTAAEVFGVPPTEVSPEQRGRAKTINFGLMYGMGAQSLARQLRIPLREASGFIERYFARLPAVRAFRERLLEEARGRGYVTTLMGRRVSLPALGAADRRAAAQAERVAINAPLQGSAADLVKRAMVDLDRALRERRLAARLLIQVHDELVLEAEAGAAEEAAALARECMEGAARLRVPLAASVGTGVSWDEIH
ncbi:MAG TPA: DNA polymerase I [Candidatus Saccharimonadales bacterium]|nr:DNA polymerase I [Candidatus Saccharimonadales bacterium]